MFIIFLRVIYLKTYIKIFYTVTGLYLSEIYLFIYLFNLFIYFILFIFLLACGISVSHQFNSSTAFTLIFAIILSKFPDAFLRATVLSFSKAL